MCSPINIDNTQPRNQPKINLSNCKKGQKLLRRNGTIVTLGGRANGSMNTVYQIIDGQDSNYVYANGRGNLDQSASRDHFNDIIKILPLENVIKEPISTSSSMTTPRTDKAEFQMWDGVNEEYYSVVTSAVARRLETELEEAMWLLKQNIYGNHVFVAAEAVKKYKEQKAITLGWIKRSATIDPNDTDNMVWVHPSNGLCYFELPEGL